MFLIFLETAQNVFKKRLTIKVYHSRALTWHIPNKSMMPMYTQIRMHLCTHMSKHKNTSSVVNLVHHNDLTKIVNTITYRERANHKSLLHLHSKKYKDDIEEGKKAQKKTRRGILEKKVLSVGHSGTLGLSIIYSIHAHHKHAYTPT